MLNHKVSIMTHNFTTAGPCKIILPRKDYFVRIIHITYIQNIIFAIMLSQKLASVIISSLAQYNQMKGKKNEYINK